MGYKATICLFLLLFLPLSSNAANDDQALRVSELFFESVNKGWVELYNIGNQPIDLSTFYVGDSNSNFQLPEKIAAPGDYILIGLGNAKENAPYIPEFSIDGNVFYLKGDNNTVKDKLPVLQIGKDASVGRVDFENGSIKIFDKPTPGEPNHDSYTVYEFQPPSFSVQPGFYSENISLSIETIYSGAEIRYTLDGSTPNEDSPLYTGELLLTNRAGDENVFSMIPTNNIPPGHIYDEEWQPPLSEVKKLNVVKARVFFPNADQSPVAAGSYLISENVENRFSMPVISISTDKENFFDDEIGIYVHGNNVNYNQRGREWERPVYFEFFESDGTPGFAQNMGARIHGGTSRSRPRKSLRMYARSDYGTSWVNYQLFPDKQISEFKRFILRNSGNDWDRAIFRDAFMQNLIEDLDVDMQHSRPAIVFINGEYWGIHNIRDRFDQRYIETHYGLDDDEFTMMENNSVFDRGNENGVAHYNQMRSFLNNPGVSNPDNYAELKTRMDVENFIDYQAAQIYFRNTDWPGNNLQYWRSFNDYNPDAPFGLDGRWRWMMFDTDFGFNLDFDYVTGHPAGPAHNTLAFALQQNGPGWPNPDWSTFILRMLVQNQQFRNDFINRFADLLNTNFREDVVVAKIDSMEALYIPEMEEHINRWVRPEGIPSWQETLDSMRSFGEQRPTFMRNHIMQQFNVPGTYELTLNVNDASKGIIKVNRTRIESGTAGVSSEAYPWTGVYFRTIPMTFSAEPKSGYRFVQWQGASSSTQPVITLTLTSNQTLTAIFEPDDETPGTLDPWNLSDEPYTFSEWNANATAGTYPPSMIFLQTDIQDPGLDDEMTEPWLLPYDLESRSRINGLGQNGFAFINTSNPQNDGGGYLGAAVLAINTTGLYEVSVTWRGGTVRPNSRVYNIRLQYRVGSEDDFQDVLFDNGEPVEYKRNEVEGHSELLGPVILPNAANNREYVELRWKYYYTGIRLDEDSGQRSKIRVGDILVTAGETSQAARLDFENVYPAAQHNVLFRPFTVLALDEEGAVDLFFSEDITLNISGDDCGLEGTTTVTADGGEAVFSDLIFIGTGECELSAESESLETEFSEMVRVVKLTEIIMPSVIQGAQPDNNDRVPFVFRVELEGLMPNTTYRYYNRIIDEDDPFEQNGAGNAIFVNSDGGDFIRTTASPRFRPADFGERHYEFTTDHTGTFEGWFITEPSGNNRFTPGNMLRMRILLNDGLGGEELYHFIDTFSDVRVVRFGEIPGNGTGFVGISSFIPKNIVVMYEDEAGHSRPVTASVVENAGFETDDRFAEFYTQMVASSQGHWGTILPNDLPDGIRRIEERSLLDGFVTATETSADGIWGEGVNTVNPSGGLENPVVLSLSDAVPIELPNDIPSEFKLSQNYPNPFNPSTQISYGIPEASHVRLEVYSINGQLVTVLQNGFQSAGFHTVTFDSRNLNMASGVYLYRIEAGEFVQVKKMLLVK